jgi:hypothetical protein
MDRCACFAADAPSAAQAPRRPPFAKLNIRASLTVTPAWVAIDAGLEPYLSHMK